MEDDGRDSADGNMVRFPHDAEPYDGKYANWPYADSNVIPGGFVASSIQDGNMEAYPLQVLDAMGQSGQYLTHPLALNTATHGISGGGQWPGASAQTTAWVADQVSDAGLEPSSSSIDATPYAYQSEYFGPSNAIPAAYASSFTSNSPWATTTTASTSLSPTSPSQQQSQDWATPAAGPSSEKVPPVRKKRGRPRLYEDDGTEVPKCTSGRPPVYSLGSSSSGSSSKASPSAAAAPSGFVVPSTNRFGRSSKEEDAKQTSVRARNKAAATRYRQKTQAAIAEMEAEERAASLKRQALMACAGRLKEEVFQLKNEVLRHADCGCPLIEGYLSNAAQQAAMSLGETAGISQRMDGMSLASGGGAGDARVMHLEKCNMVFGDGGYFEGGYVEGWQGLGTDVVDCQRADGQGADGDESG